MMLALVIIEGLVILLLSVLVAGLLRSHAEILRRLHAIGAGEDPDERRPWAPAAIRPGGASSSPTSLTGATPSGGQVSVALSAGRGTTVMAFLSTGCLSCRPFWQRFAGELDLPGEDVRPLIVTKGPHEESPSQVAALAPADVTTLMSSEAWDAFRVPATPYFVLVDNSNGAIVGEGSAGSWPHLADLMRRALGDARVERRHSGQGRLRDTDEELARAGITPTDPTLHQRPTSE
jgi:hypothetical protein